MNIEHKVKEMFAKSNSFKHRTQTVETFALKWKNNYEFGSSAKN